MLTIQPQDGVQVFTFARSSTAVTIIARHDGQAFVLPLQLTGLGLGREATVEQIRASVLQKCDLFVEAVQKRLKRYKTLIGRKLKIHIPDFHREVEVCIDGINDKGIAYTFSWDDECASHTIRFAGGEHHHVFYVDDEGFSPQGLEMMTSVICSEVATYERNLCEPIVAIEKYVSERPDPPFLFTMIDAMLDSQWQPIAARS